MNFGLPFFLVAMLAFGNLAVSGTASKRDMQSIDSQLDKAVRRFLDDAIFKSDSKRIEKFTSAQTSWSNYREMQSRFMADFVKLPDSENLPKEIQEGSYRTFYVQLTKERIQHLTELLITISNHNKAEQGAAANP